MAQFVDMLHTIGIPFAYHHFAESNAPVPPFGIYLLPSSHHFIADGKNYHKIVTVHLEIYTDKKDVVLEKRVEDILDEQEIVYSKSEVWIESERLYEVLYTFEMEEEKIWQIKSNTI